MAYVMVAVAGFNALNAIQQGRTAKGQADLQAQQSEYQAQQEQETALETARIIRRAGRRQVGAATAGYAAAGVRVDQGSAADVQGQIAQDVEHDAFQAILDGGRRAGALRTDAALTRINGRMQRSAGYVNAVGSVLQGGASALRAGGWRTGGPGFSGQQAPAPVETRIPVRVGG